MNGFLPGMEIECRNHDLSQWYTPPWLAERVWSWCPDAVTVLEPSAGDGALVKPILREPRRVAHITAVDIDEANAFKLRALSGDPFFLNVCRGDFLQWPWSDAVPCTRFDLSLQNTPYEDGQAEAFILHALEFAARIVGIFKASILHGRERDRSLWSKCHTEREARLKARPRFGAGVSSDSAKSDFVVLDIVAGPTVPRSIWVENW